MGDQRTWDGTAPRLEVVTDLARLAELRGPWTELWARTEHTGLFQSFEYCRDAWELVERPRGQALACLVGWRGDELIAAWPFVTRRNRLWTYGRQLVASGVELHELLIDPSVDSAEWTRQAWRALSDSTGVDVVELSFDPTSSSAAALEALPARDVEATTGVAVSVALSQVDDWDAYQNSLSKSYRKNHARARRRLDQLGTVAFVVIEAGDERIAPVVDWLLTQKRRWAEHTGKKGDWLYSDRYREFLVRQLNDPHQSVRNVLFTLTLDGATIAASIGAVSKTRFDGVIAAFDADHEKSSPGALLTGDVVRWVWEQRLDAQLGLGAEPYKKYWSRGEETAIAHRRVAVSRWGAVALALRRAAQARHERRTRAEHGGA